MPAGHGDVADHVDRQRGRNPDDGRDYIISYNDCLRARPAAAAVSATATRGDTPVYMPAKSNDLNWCLGTSNIAYHCSVSIVLGVATEDAGTG